MTLLEVIPAGACPELDERVPGSPFLLLLDFAEPLDFVPGTEDEDLPLLDPSLELRMTGLDDDEDLTFLEEVEDLAFLLLLDPSWLSPLWMTIFDDDEDLTVVEELLKSSGAGDEPLSSPQAVKAKDDRQ